MSAFANFWKNTLKGVAELYDHAYVTQTFRFSSKMSFMCLKSFWVCSSSQNKPKTYLDQVYTDKSDASKPTWTSPWESKNMAPKMLENLLRLYRFLWSTKNAIFLASRGPTNILWVCRSISEVHRTCFNRFQTHKNILDKDFLYLMKSCCKQWKHIFLHNFHKYSVSELFPPKNTILRF